MKSFASLFASSKQQSWPWKVNRPCGGLTNYAKTRWSWCRRGRASTSWPSAKMLRIPRSNISVKFFTLEHVRCHEISKRSTFLASLVPDICCFVLFLSPRYLKRKKKKKRGIMVNIFWNKIVIKNYYLLEFFLYIWIIIETVDNRVTRLIGSTIIGWREYSYIWTRWFLRWQL